ncbi:M23 family metallopeptidase [Phyllobacterium myrsinacearum]|uniref:Murein DD-endopeptidase MepM/ murein hydrolase activator NlpD n=1 Tax=Phyllobacterium myrsinacearum TaxID=28101 RepID=A0A839ER67_9HYPH|nr:M23 family metallopeptidase [Phyllobacterium myrsinacearum]MBA8880718.1 murein DD-endopeptidase MepM/ murein hydrolase activator NlpD [Phyllobacterium myrsinacearum]
MKKAKHSPIFSNQKEPHTIIIARGETIRHFTLRPWAAILGGTLAFALAGTYLIATSYLVFRDDLISGSVARQARLQQAYEDRIANLRTQLDQVTSRQLLDQQVMENKVSELIRRQKSLAERHDKLAPVLQRAEDAGAVIAPEIEDNAPMDSNSQDVVKSEDDEGFYGIDPIITGPTTVKHKSEPRGEKPAKGVDKAEILLKSVNTSLTDIEAKQIAQMQTLSNTAYENADKIMEALAATGVKPVLDEKSDTGGPFIPAGSIAPFDAKLNDLDQALERLESAKALAKSIPISNPVPGMPVSSTFGVRKDPIIGSMAFHSGIDFRAITGSSVRATANGTVTEADYNGGYGNMVEVDHGNGLATRYGHMSQILVSVGQKIKIGDIVGKVGSTGRSTGPHLHYEVRRNGSAINPAGFLTIGREVAAEL